MADEVGNVVCLVQPTLVDYTGTSLEEVQGWGWERCITPITLNGFETKFSGHGIPVNSGKTLFRCVRERASTAGSCHALVPIRDAHGKVLRWFGTNTDITAQKQAEEDVVISRQRLSLAMRLSGMGSYDWTPSTGQVIWDEQHLSITGMPSAVMTGAEFLARVLPEDVERNRVAIERTLAGKPSMTLSFAFNVPMADGSG